MHEYYIILLYSDDNNAGVIALSVGEGLQRRRCSSM